MSATETEGIPWKLRVEEPTNRFVYYPIAHRLVAWLKDTWVTPNQVTLIQPLIAVVAAVCIASGDPRVLFLGAVIFELRSMLDCVDGTLARAKKVCSPGGHALDAFCDWLGVTLLYAGIFAHFLLHAPPAGPWSQYASVAMVVGVALFQGAVRSFAADYFMRKYGSLLAEGRDATVEELREQVNALGPDSPAMTRAEVFIGRMQHLSFQQEWFDPGQTPSLGREQVEALRAQENRRTMRLVAKLWSISNGDFFIRLTVISVALGHEAMWSLQLFWAVLGLPWIISVVMLNSWYLRRVTQGDAQPIEA